MAGLLGTTSDHLSLFYRIIVKAERKLGSQTFSIRIAVFNKIKIN